MKWKFDWLELFFGGCNVFVSNEVLKNMFWYHRVLVVGSNFLFCHVPDLTTEQKSHFTILIWPCRGPKTKNNIRILKKFLFWFHTQFLFFLLSVSGLIFHGAQPYNWWRHKLANIEPTNYALLFWLVYLSLLQYLTNNKSLLNFSILLLIVIFQNNGKQIFFNFVSLFGNIFFFFVDQLLEALVNFWRKFILHWLFNSILFYVAIWRHV
jgi:hypothetical protein